MVEPGCNLFGSFLSEKEIFNSNRTCYETDFFFEKTWMKFRKLRNTKERIFFERMWAGTTAN